MKKYALIGKSLSHSFSKTFFTNYFKDKDVDSQYSNLELTSIEEFDAIKHEFDGFNVTIPYKEAIIPYLDELTREASEIGAVNTIRRSGDIFIGHNTDAYGFHMSIKPFLSNKHERAIILGTGGASKAVSYVLENLGIDVIFISRTPTKSNEFGYDEVNELMLDVCKLVVNTTPIGMFPNVDDKPKIDLSSITKDHLIVDLIYNPDKTKFLLEAQEAGAMVLNGESMLKLQALKSYEIWGDV